MLKIAQLVLPWISLPPKGYTGTERVVFWLTEELKKRGHKVTLFSVKESRTKANLEYTFEKPLGLQKDVSKTIRTSFLPLLHVAKCFAESEKFDIIHSHAQFLGLAFSEIVSTPVLHTFHRTLNEGLNEDEKELLKKYRHLNFSSISNSQRIKGLNFLKTVYNGIPIENFPFSKEKGKFLLWVGRIVGKKGPEEAISVAKKLNMQLVLIGNITEPEFFSKRIKPHIDQKQIKYLGELKQERIIPFYQKALCTLCPVKWNEPFGLTAVESMACGTPVVAFKQGGLKETVRHEKTGFLVKDVNGLVQAVKKIDIINRRDCRNHVEENFTVKKMASDYEKLYYEIL